MQVIIKHLRMDRDAALDAYQLIRETLDRADRKRRRAECAQWQAVALNTKAKRAPKEYMDLRFVNEVVTELARK